MVLIARLGTILLGIWAILFGLGGFGLVVPAVILNVLLIVAGICLLASQVRGAR